MAVTTAKPSPLKVIQVSVRDRAIFEAVQVNCRSQRAVAVEFKLSQARVSAIVKRVARWLGQGAPPGFEELPRAARLRSVSRLHRMRLEHFLHEAVEAWQKSDSTTHTITEKVSKGEVVNRVTKVQTRNRDLRQMRHIAEIEDRITAFEGFDKQGKVDESCQGRVYEEPDRTPEEDRREVKRRIILGGFDTPGDEGIPGLWGEEMEQRNAEVGRQKAEVGAGEVRNAECGVRSEGNGEVKVRESGAGEADEAPAQPKTPRQQSEISLAPVLRGEGRGEGPAGREDVAVAGALLSLNVTNSAQHAQQHDVTAEETQQILLSKAEPTPKPEPTPKRYRLMGTAAEMAVSKSYDEYFSLEERIFRATEKAREAQQRGKAKVRQTQGQPLTPALSPEYRGEGVRFNA
jgi:hypothetical protein